MASGVGPWFSVDNSLYLEDVQGKCKPLAEVWDQIPLEENRFKTYFFMLQVQYNQATLILA